MKPYIFYEDIPKDERKQLNREAIREYLRIRLWRGFSVGLAVFIALTVSSFHQELPARLITVALLSAGLAVAFYRSIVAPQIIRAVERQKNSQQTTLLASNSASAESDQWD